MSLKKSEALAALTFGQRIAEDETAELGRYFVLTDQWRQLLSGAVDIVYGYKGAGKSALYASLLARRDELFDRGILLVAGENVRGAPAFSDLVDDPPASEAEFKNLWKLYFLQLVGGSFREFDLSSEPARELLRKLEEAGLLPKQGGLGALIRSALDYVRRPRVESVQTTLELDRASGMPSGVTGKITFREPNAAAQMQGFASVDTLFELADQALASEHYSLWILLDRLDVAFVGSADLEAHALRALFMVYGDLRRYEHVRLKIFLRTDIWERITAEGFREASHLTRSITIQWDKKSLMNLIIKRALAAPEIEGYFEVQADRVLASLDAQQELFYRMFPQQVEVGGGRPNAFDWMVSRTQDASRRTAPRELIHLLSEARNVQLKKLEIGEREPDGETIIAGHNVKEALKEVSRVRLTQTLFAEYPQFQPYLQKLRGGKSQHSRETLAELWGISKQDAGDLADRLSEIGFFERRGEGVDVDYWVPFLYRDSLDMIRGAAD